MNQPKVPGQQFRSNWASFTSGKKKTRTTEKNGLSKTKKFLKNTILKSFRGPL